MTREFENILSECLERITEKGDSIEACLIDYPEHASQLEPLLRKTLSANGRKPDMQASSELEGQAQDGTPNETLGHPKSKKVFRKVIWKYRWVFPAFLLLLVLISSGVLIGSNDSVPGDPLYSTKTKMEKVRLKLTPSDLNKAKLHVEFAERRAEEMIEMGKSNKTNEVQVLADRTKDELNHVLLLAESIRDDKDGEDKVEKVKEKLQLSSVLNSDIHLFDENFCQVKIAVEETLLKLTTSEVSQAMLRIEFAGKRVQKIVEISQKDRFEEVDELFQGIEQHLASLNPLVESLASRVGKAKEVGEIKIALENSAVQNINMFRQKMETATVQTRLGLEQNMERTRICFYSELESLNSIK